jgi:CheY-like chemotaxis protein
MSTSLTAPLVFKSRELPQKLLAASQENRTGYWEFQFAANGDAISNFYLAMAQGRVVFLGPQKLSWSAFLQNLQRYIPSLRTSLAKQSLHGLEKEVPAGELEILSKMLTRLEKRMSLSHQNVLELLQLQILADFDQYLLNSAGQAQFTPSPDLVLQAPIAGIKVESLLLQAQTRQQEWNTLKQLIPSMEAIPILNAEALEQSNLAPEQKQLIQKLTGLGKSLDVLAYVTAKDPLETARMFARLVRGKLVSLQLPSQTSEPTVAPEIFIVDDSPVFLQQFQALVKSWGYQVNYWSNATTAVQKLLEHKPSAVFLDVNMPGMTGFDLMKEIRREPELASVSLVLLTAENSLSNQWRAKWGNCKFVAKPRTPEEIQSFKTELRHLLLDLVPMPE